MGENQRTIIYVAAAIVLAALAWLLSPKSISSEVFGDQGQEFYPEFTDPNEAVTLEVIEFDEASASPIPFKVTFEGGKWTIPSHHNYPADGKDRLAKTAAGIIGVTKDDFRSDNTSDLESFGLIDPLDETAGLTGRGTRITIKAEGDRVLADYVVGREVPGRVGMRFVRVPDQNRVYAAKMDIDLSTRFEDWIDTDLLQSNKYRFQKLVIEDYSINERTRRISQRDVVTLTSKDGEWRADKMSGSQQMDTTHLETMLNTLDSLTIVGVRPKPAGLTASLQKAEQGEGISQGDARSLQSKGFFFGNDGRLLSNEGELRLYTKDGVQYVLRFGEVVYGSGDALTAGTKDGDATEGPAENRYLFVSAEFDPSLLPEPPQPTDTTFVGKPDSLLTDADRENKSRRREHQRWSNSVQNGRQKAEELNGRFAQWYYVISSDSYEKLRLKRSDLVIPREG